MEINMMVSLKAERKIANISYRVFSIIILSCILMLTGCFTEEINTMSKPGTSVIQLHNFNIPLEGGSLDGTAPDVYYFKQKQDGSYLFMLTYTNNGGFQTNWATEYVQVKVDASGVIQKMEAKKLPVNDGLTGTFDYVFQYLFESPFYSSGIYNEWFKDYSNNVGQNYVADEIGMLYSKFDMDCFCRNQYFNLNPETGQTDYFLTGGPVLPQIFRTSDGGFITIGGSRGPDYHKFSASGNLEYKQPMKYWEANPTYVYLTERNGDHYFLTTYHGPDVKRFSENTAKSFYYFRDQQDFLWWSNIDFEIRFGPGRTQKAHRFPRTLWYGASGKAWNYQNYADVPFEVWDITDINNPRQLMASFRDQNLNGSFTLVEMNYDMRNYFRFCCGPLYDDPNQSQEWIMVHPIPYSTTPSEDIILNGPFIRDPPFWDLFIVIGQLTNGANWNPSSLPTSSISFKSGPRPTTQILKVNANGSSVVKDNYLLGSGTLHNMFKSVPYLDGSVVLINVPSPDYPNPATQLSILDADFNQKIVLNMVSNPADHAHQLEYNKEKDKVFYARMTNNPNASPDYAYKGSLMISVIKDNSVMSEKYLDEFIPFKLEKYRITPTKTGGVAIVAWVRPTKDTRDLLFLELDENLELVKR